MSLNKKLIIEELEGVPLDKYSYYLIMGSALVMYGIKESTNDIDIGCMGSAFDLLVDKGYEVLKSRSGLDKISFSKDISIYREWRIDYVINIEGIPVADLKSILNDKIRLGRQKDIEDIQKIREFISIHYRNGEDD